MFINQNIIGIVMCGGQSTRMGQDKGLLLKGNLTWVELAIKKLHILPVPTLVSINSSQLEKYTGIIESDHLVTDTTNIPGPLGGVLSVHLKYPTHDILILACDMIDITINSIQYLFNYCTEEGSEFDFIVYTNEQNQPEPLLGWYSSEGLSKIYKYYLMSILEKFSMKHILEISNTHYLAFPNPYDELKNYNNMF